MTTMTTTHDILFRSLFLPDLSPAAQHNSFRQAYR